MKEASALYRLLGDEARLRLLRVLDKDRFNVKELTGILGLAQSGVSRHRGLLKESDLVVEERDGAYSFYRLSPSVRDAHGPLWPLAATLLTGLTMDQIGQLGGLRLEDPWKKTVLWEWHPDVAKEK